MDPINSNPNQFQPTEPELSAPSKPALSEQPGSVIIPPLDSPTVQGAVLQQQPIQKPIIPQTQTAASVQLNVPKVYRIKLTKCTGIVVFSIFRSNWVEGTYEQCLSAYKDAQTYNLLFGWWSWISIIFANWYFLYINYSSLNKLKTIARVH